MSFFGWFVVVLPILFLRLVDLGFQDHLSGTRLDVEPREIQIARPRRPPQDTPDLIELLGPYREYRPSGPGASRHPRASTTICELATRRSGIQHGAQLPGRRYATRNHPLRRPQR